MPECRFMGSGLGSGRKPRALALSCRPRGPAEGWGPMGKPPPGGSPQGGKPGKKKRPASGNSAKGPAGKVLGHCGIPTASTPGGRGFETPFGAPPPGPGPEAEKLRQAGTPEALQGGARAWISGFKKEPGALGQRSPPRALGPEG
ncbi:collagen alpha-1(I) chain-like [Penaeus monodon]|uniref:collagen alpha-1(I) chain-like n=1 Tax=Penaeus monodon TaxID=6687 RepID=UPI0018A7AF24|nr:collagen alpha-1(I) chain-like [Penaeus monodon]